VKYTYQQYISDLNGIDTKAHGDDPLDVIRQIRTDWQRNPGVQQSPARPD